MRHTVIQVLPQSVVEHVFVIMQQPIGIPVIKRVKVAVRTKSGTAVLVCVMNSRIRTEIAVSNVPVVVHRPVRDVVVQERTRIGMEAVV